MDYNERHGVKPIIDSDDVTVRIEILGLESIGITQLYARMSPSILCDRDVEKLQVVISKADPTIVDVDFTKTFTPAECEKWVEGYYVRDLKFVSSSRPNRWSYECATYQAERAYEITSLHVDGAYHLGLGESLQPTLVTAN
jgi:hypothetical protein